MQDLQLDENRKGQLDTNIKKMLEGGATQDDVMKYATDFKGQFGQKKNPVGNVLNNGTSNTSQSKLPSQLPSPNTKTDFLQQGYDLASGKNLNKSVPQSIGEGVSRDKKKNDSLIGGIYNTLVGSLSRLAGGLVEIGESIDRPLQKLFKDDQKPEDIVWHAPVNSGRELVVDAIDNTLRSSSSSRENEQARSKFDITDGVSGSDIKAMAFQAPSQLADMLAGAFTRGSSFFAQSVNDNAKELEENPNSPKLTDGQRMGYLFTQAAVQAALEKFALNKVFKATGLGKVAAQKITAEITEELIEKGVKATAKQIEEMALKKVASFASKAKRVGIKTATSAGVEGGTEALQSVGSDAIKLLTNKFKGEELFDEGDITANMVKNMLNAGVQGAAFGGVFGGGASVLNNTNKALRNDIAKGSNLEAVQQKIAEQIELGNITEDEAAAANITAQQYAQIASKIPTEIPEEKKYQIIGGIEQRENLKRTIEETVKEAQEIDNAFPEYKQGKQDQIDLLNDKLEQTNDYINEIVTGKPTKYSKKVDGRTTSFYKTEPNGKETQISREYYDLAIAAREETDRKNVIRETVPTGNITDGVTIQLPKPEKTLLQEDVEASQTAEIPKSTETENIAVEKVNPIIEPTKTEPNGQTQEKREERGDVLEPETATEGTGGEQPPVTETSGVTVERPKTELSFKGLQDVSNEFGYQDVKSRESVTDVQERQNATNTANEWVEKGEYADKIEDMLSKVDNGDMALTAKQRLILQQHLANEAGKLRKISDINSPEWDKQHGVVERIRNIGLKARQEAGAGLRIGNDLRSHPIEDFDAAFTAKKEATGVDELTQKQKEEVAEQIKIYEEKTKEAEAKVSEMQELMAKMNAEKEFQEAKKSTPRTKKSKEDYTKIREDLKTSIREKWANAGKDGTLSSDLPFRKQIAAIAPDVAKLVRTYVDEGFTELKDVIEKVRGIIPELSEKDVNDIIAGEYNQKKEPLSKLQSDLRDLKDEAKLLNELEKVKNGVPKTEKQKVERNQKIKDLQEQLEKLKKDTGYNDLSKLKSIKSRNEADTKKINERIQNKDFDNTPKPKSIFDDKELQSKYPKEYKETLDAIKAKEDVKQQFDLALFKDERSRDNKAQKFGRHVGKAVNTLKAIKTGIDLSGIGIQTLFSSLARPRVGLKSIGTSLEQLASKKKFDRWLTELHNSEMYPLMEKSGLAITEPNNLKAQAEEAFSGRYSKIKIRGKEYDLPDRILAPFERAFTSLGNSSRALAFSLRAEKYLDQGFTFENNPKLFKSLAERLNTQTGRGKLNEKIQAANEIVSKGIWSPRLLASRLNLLGVTDLVSKIPGAGKLGTKGFYSQMHPTERAQALKDIGRGITTIVAVTAALAYSTGGEVDWNPFSSTFMTIKWDNGKSTNLTGGMSSLIRYILQVSFAKEYKDGEWKDINSIDRALRFFRSKTPPVTGALINARQGKDFMGKPTSLGEEAIQLFKPISTEPLMKGFKEDGIIGSFAKIPEFLVSSTGFNIRDEKEFDGKDDDLKTLLRRNMTSEEQNKKEFRNYKQSGRPITKSEEKQYNKERDAYIEIRLTDLWNGKDDENIVKDVENNTTPTLTWQQMSREQIKDAITKIKQDATDEIKKRLFGEKKIPWKEKKLNKQLQRLKKL